MSQKNKKKKPGDMAAARLRHLHRQAIQDAITKATFEPGTPVSLEMHGCKWELTALSDRDRLEMILPARCLVRVTGNKLQIGWVSEKDGMWLEMPKGMPYHVHDDNVLGYVVPKDAAAEAYC